ncbi:MAG: polysaccharide biosynthesis protein HfsI [Elainellaceae cyanobacterium]
MMKKPLVFAEQAFTAIALLLHTGGPLNVILSGGYSQGDKQIAEPDFGLTRNLYLLTYLVVFCLLTIRWRKVLYVLQRDRYIWAILALVLLSFFWSEIPSRTLSRSISFTGSTLLGVYFATRYTLKQQLQLLGWTFGLVVGLSLIYALLLPKYGIMGGVHAGAWRGIYTHKNNFGKMMTLSSVVFTLLLMSGQKQKLWFSLGLGLSVMLLLLSTSKGALVNVMAMWAAIAVCRLFRLQYHLLVISLGSIAVAAGGASLWLLDNLESIVVDVLGKDLTLTGRTDLWITVLEMIEQRPWLGYGYQAFWDGLDGPSAVVWRAEAWQVPDAHNGFLDLLLQLGIVGMAVFLIGYFANAIGSIVRLRSLTGSEFIWPVPFLIFMILSNLPETSLMRANDIFWVLYVAIALSRLMPPEDNSQNLDLDDFSNLDQAPELLRQPLSAR